MINEEKVRLMTKCAIYEDGKGKEEIPLAGYFKTDYIRCHVLKTMIAVFFAFLVMFLVYIGSNLDSIIEMLNHLNYQSFVFVAIMILLGLMAFYFIVARIVYSLRFEAARERMNGYYHNLKELQKLYEKEADTRPTVFEEGGESRNDEFIDY